MGMRQLNAANVILFIDPNFYVNTSICFGRLIFCFFFVHARAATFISKADSEINKQNALHKFDTIFTLFVVIYK